MHLDHDRCATAVRSKDPRFDGWFVTGVLSTGIYCRPSCPAITPRVVNMRFFPSAAAAQGAGFRACKRCRPDATPGSPEWRTRSDVAARAVRLVADGVVDREGVSGLASRLGYSVRQVERLVTSELGAGPLALARAQRAQTARLLIEGTDLSMAEVAFAAGFSSIRSFNDTVRAVYATAPRELRSVARSRSGAAVGQDSPRAGGDGGATRAARLHLRLPFRTPLHTPSLFGHLAATLAPGVEVWRDGALERALALPHGAAVVTVRPPGPSDRHVHVVLRLLDVRDLAAAIDRCRRLLDLDADPHAVDDHLAGDRALAPLAARTPGVRLPGSVDAAELALRAVLGQQISTTRAAGLAARLVEVLGRPLPTALTDQGGPTHLFPSPSALADAPDDAYPGMPGARRGALRGLATALATGDLDLSPGASWKMARLALLALPGIGPWTTEIIALRGLGDPDAFPSTDLGLRTAARAAGLDDSTRALQQRADAWRPWRSYAVQLLWASSDHAAARLPDPDTPGRGTRPHTDHDRAGPAWPQEAS
ncbi:AlkA N-terminal domain-containing protein [Ornithinimicrobium pekingense]|uniref:DNA-3-methyladenine glycosylase II n=1 Tax=Ornithinimicrobium pekingense TaxID=384677 RepID=A0ABQ2F4M6_9MICO|nr:AlkA N-terminal domain-containing protein [Ornithinimicrobium pekingense]GGK58070.1 DNA-3-methyladenine glycosylase [Ornithinimicrobium pekingense]